MHLSMELSPISLTDRLNKKKNPCSEEGRALKPGVTYKYISASCLDAALQIRLEQVHDKVASTSEAYVRLQNSWKLSNTTRPFIESLVGPFDEQKLTDFDS